jgi:hypothetical protein
VDKHSIPRVPWWAQAALIILWLMLVASSPGLRRDWTPYVYPESAPSNPHLYQASERSLRECQESARLSARVWSDFSGEPMAAICMRECWPFEGVVRPEAVRTINRKCRVFVMVDTPRVEAALE